MESEISRNRSDVISIKEYLAETVTRIRRQRRSQQLQKLRADEKQRAEDNSFRIKWKESVKEKRNREVIEKVDEVLYDSIIRINAEIVSHKHRNKYDLDSDEECDNNIPIVSFLSRKEDNENQLNKLIGDLIIREHIDRKRDSGEYKISFPSKHSNKQASFEFTSGGEIPASVKYLQRIGAYGLQVREKLDDPCQGQGYSGLHDNSNKLQLGDLLSDLLNIQSMKKDDILNIQRLPSGMMLKVIQDAQHSWFKPFRVERSPSIQVSPSATTVNNYNGAEVPSGGIKKVNHAPKLKNMLMACLVEKIFIVGPDDQQIISFLHDALEKDGKGKTPDRLKGGHIQPTILFSTEDSKDDVDDANYPPEMAMQLPGYCYPRSVDIQVRLPPLTEGSNLRRSLNQILKEPPKTTSALETASKKKSRFFSSEYNVFNGEKLEEPVIEGDKSFKSMVTIPCFTRYEAKNEYSQRQQPFILQLGDHTYQNYCVAQSFNVSYVETATRAVVHTSYTLCVMTRFPFFSYLSYIVGQCEKDSKFMNFEVPLPKYDPHFPLNPQLRSISDLHHRLHKVKVQLYPFLSSKKRKNKVEIASSEDIDASDCVAIINDVIARVSLKNQDRKLIDYRRSLYQIFYSSHPRNFEDISDGLLASIKFQEKLEKMSIDFVPTSLHKSEKDKEETFLILQWTLPTLLKYLPLDQVILCLGCAMTEMKIIVKHKDINVISSIILALQRLLRPLKWCSPVIITVTEEMMDLIESPVPIMLGMQSLPEKFELLEGYVVVDPEVKTVHLHPIDIVQSHTTLLPNASTLFKALSPHAATIIDLWRKRKNQRQKVTITLQSEHVENMDSLRTEVLPNVLSVPPEIIPLELDITDPACLQFSGAIQQFSSIVSTHILAILNTGIQLQQKEKEEARQKRRVVTKQTKTDQMSPSRTDQGKDAQHIRSLSPLSTQIPLKRDVQIPSVGHHFDFDDAVSDLTATDIPTMRGSNDMESVKGDSSGGASIASSSSSLPSLRSDAPVLRENALGQTGVKFVRKVIDTQMYSNYCQSLKVDEKGFWVIDGSFYNLDPSYVPQSEDATVGKTFLSTEEKTEEFDSLLGVFEIMTSGTIAIKPEEFDALKKKYQCLYSNDMTREKLSRLAPPTSASNKIIGLEKAKLTAHKQLALMRMAEGKRVAISDIGKYHMNYCTGLSCQGDCNTELCSELCLSIWQKKVQRLRRKKAAFEAICLKYEKRANEDANISDTNQYPDGSSIASPLNGTSRIEFILKDGVRLEPLRHGRETESQYLKRKEVVSQNIISKIAKSGPSVRHKRRKSVTALSFEHATNISAADDLQCHKRDIKKRVFASGNCDDYTYALAAHFAKKESKLVQKYFKVNRAIVYRFIRRFVAYCRRMAFRQSVIYCQSIMRGFLLRKKLLLVVDWLYYRKQSRFIGKLIIRNYIRIHKMQFLRNLERWKNMKLMKRRTSLNLRIPSIPAVAAVEFNGSSSILHTNNVVSAPSKVPTNMSQISSKFISEPSLKFTEESTKDKPVDSSSKLLTNNIPFENPKKTMNSQVHQYLNLGVMFRAGTGGSSPANISSRLTSASKLPGTFGFGRLGNGTPVTSPHATSAGSSLVGSATSQSEDSLLNAPKSNIPANTQSVPVPFIDVSDSCTIIPTAASDQYMHHFPKSPTGKSSKSSSVTSSPQELSANGSPDINVRSPTLRTVNAMEDISLSPGISLLLPPSKRSDETSVVCGSSENIVSEDSEHLGVSDNCLSNAVASKYVIALSMKKVDSQDQLPDNSDNESATKSVAHSQKYIPSSASVVSGGASVVTASNTSSGKTADPTKRKKNTPIGKITEANNYAVSNVVATAGNVRGYGRNSYGSTSQQRSDTVSVSSRSQTNTYLEDTASTVDGESKSDRNTMMSSERSDGDDEKSINKSESDDSPIKLSASPMITQKPSPLIDPSGRGVFPTGGVLPPVYPPRPKLLDDQVRKPTIDSSPKSLHDASWSRINSQDDCNFDSIDTDDLVTSHIDDNFADYPMKTFGEAGRNRFTSQQINLIKNLYELLRNGVAVYKHGRKGRPNWKTLYCDLAMTKFYWRSLNSKREKDEIDEDLVPILNNHSSSSTAFHIPNPQSREKRRTSVFMSKDDSEREIKIREIKVVTNECSSDVLQRSISKHYIGSDNCEVLCMKAINRSLDLEVEKSKWDQIYPALQVVVDFYNQELEKDDFKEDHHAPVPVELPVLMPNSQHSSSFAALFNNQEVPEEIATTSTTSLGIKAGILQIPDHNMNGLEYDTAGRKEKGKK